jgi:gluconate 2-dehydrogenase subunit 3-like protein
MKRISRRAALSIMSAAPAAAVMSWTPAEAEQAHQHAQTARKTTAKTGAPFKPKFFTAHEYATVAVLVDLIIPKDEKSGSATEAGVPEFMDFMMTDDTTADKRRQTAMRGGLALLDRLCEAQFANKAFAGCSDAERRQLLDEIAFPAKARPERSHAVAFFNSFRDLTASGFWSSKMGVADLQYTGNTFVREWKGCSDAALKKLGVSYEA